MRYLSYDEILSIHERLIEVFGGESGIFSTDALENCVSLPMMSVFGTETNPTVWSKAAALLYCILIRHPFVDGNKRTAWTAAKLFLFLNGYDLQVDVDTAEAKILQLLREESSNDSIAKWLEQCSTKI